MNKTPLPSQELVEKIGILASEYEMRYHGCAQCVLAALQEGFGIADKLTFKAATGLSGVARMGETCGALIGGLLVIGMIFGRESLEEAPKSERYQKTMDISSILIHEFNKELVVQNEKIYRRSYLGGILTSTILNSVKNLLFQEHIINMVAHQLLKKQQS